MALHVYFALLQGKGTSLPLANEELEFAENSAVVMDMPAHLTSRRALKKAEERDEDSMEKLKRVVKQEIKKEILDDLKKEIKKEVREDIDSLIIEDEETEMMDEEPELIDSIEGPEVSY